MNVLGAHADTALAHGHANPPRSSAQPRPSALRAGELTKAFGATRAVRGASLELGSGEVHAIVGENGSGKSTLVKLLAGVHRPDSGTLEIGGAVHAGLRSPRESIDAGIATVFQEILVVEARSVLENVWLGTEGVLRAPRSTRQKRELANDALQSLLGQAPPLDLPVEHLPLSDRQACVIARALVLRPTVLILDEATSALDMQIRDRLFALLEARVRDGMSVIFISHRMAEVQAIADRTTVMRSGETVGTFARGEGSVGDLVALMTGGEGPAVSVGERPAREVGETVLSHEGGFEISAGELVGLAGLEGHGQDRFLRELAIAAGDRGAYVPRERRAESLFESKSILENFGLPTLTRDTSVGVIRPARTRKRFAGLVDRLGIKLGEPGDLITTLSGGNQQKVIVARWLATDPSIFLLNDPTRGVDLGAKRDLYILLEELACRGMAVVMLSTEVDELIELMDRVIVFRDGEVFCELAREQLTRANLVGAFFGQEPTDA
jgi:ABC-type sugar transport system ATPase subunit